MFTKKWSDLVGGAVLLGTICMAIHWGSRGWESSGLLGHEFRQSQTALSIQAMAKDEFRVDYATPVLGKPWSIPMEFPIYQFLVVKVIELTGGEIAQSGRGVSAAAFLGGLPAVFLLFRRFDLSIEASCLATSLVVMAPVYIFYSRTVMIESLAWSASVWFLLGVVRFRDAPGWPNYILAVVAGAVAVLTKATTWAAFCFPWAILFMIDLQRIVIDRRGPWKRLLAEGAGIGVPLLAIGFWWVTKSDAIKAENPIANFLLSTELREFNFGSWNMRFQIDNWQVILAHWTTVILPAKALMLGGILALTQRKSLKAVGLLFGSFAGIQLLFFHLYLIHDYYFYANAIFLCGVVGIGVGNWWDQAGSRWKIKLPLLLCLSGILWIQFDRYRQILHATQVTYATGNNGLTMAIRAITSPEDVMVAHSPDWSSSLAFFSERRMLMIPDFQMFFHPERVAQSLRLLANESVPLLLMMRESREQPDWVTQRIDQLDLYPLPLFEWRNSVTAFARNDRHIEMRQILATNPMPGIAMDRTYEQLTSAERLQIAGTERETRMAQIGLTPEFGVLPYGAAIHQDSTGAFLLVHSTTELFFRIPPGATKVSVGYRINPDVYQEADFDGMTFHVDLMDEQERLTPLHIDWMSPNMPAGERDFTLAIPANSPAMLVFRALPGRRGSHAHDQGWLEYLKFE